MTERIPRPKLDSQHHQMSWYLAQQDVYSLYHFTAVENLRRIFRSHHVYSRDQIQQRGIKRVIFGDPKLSHGGLGEQRVEAYVSLSYAPHLPMAYYLGMEGHLCYLVFSHRVALTQGVLFCDRNAARQDAKRECGLAGLQCVDFEAVRVHKARRHTIENTNRQAEVLVPGALSTSAIEYVAFRSQASLDEARRDCADLSGLPPFRVEPRFFSRWSGVVNARLINRHPFRNNSMRVMREHELDRMLAVPSCEGQVVNATKGVCVLQTIRMVEETERPPIRLEWRLASDKSHARVATPGRKAPSAGHIHHLAATLGPDDLQPGTWHVTSWISLKHHTVKQFEIIFDVE